MMQMEERRSKGGFLQFFDWNSKSRKKLFSNGSDAPGEAKQGMEESKLLAKSRMTNAADGSGASPVNKGSSDWNYASSETSNDGYECRAPGVVARLMGLDSLPSSTVTDQTPTSSDDFRVLKVSCDSVLDKSNSIDYLGSSRRLAGFPSSLVEAKAHRVHNRPIERFQTEVLPPKSVKSISRSHHKLFSPIRSPGIFPPKNPEYIIEAAAKILEANPRIAGGRVTSSISASVPLRIQDLKAKLEAAYEASKFQTLHESSSGRNVGRKPVDQDYCRLEDSCDSQITIPLRKGKTDDGRYKGKSPTNPRQAKFGVQRREETSQITPRYVGKSMEQNEGNSNRISRRQPRLQRTSQRKGSVNNRATVLQQNNQKQNLKSGPYSTSKGLGSNQQLVSAHSANGYKPVNKANMKHGHNHMKKPPSNARNGYSSSRVSLLSLNKGSSALDSQRMQSVATNILISNDAVSQSMNDHKKGMDVISFTFNSPIKKFSRYLLSDGQDCPDADSSVDIPKLSFRGSTSSSPSQSVINGNSLSILLDQKLRELNSRIQPSDFETGTPESSCSSIRCLEETVSSVSARGPSADHEGGIQEVSDTISSFVCNAAEAVVTDGKQLPNVDGSQDVEGVSTITTSSATGKEVDFQQPSPVSILETSFESRSADGISTNDDSKDCSSPSLQDQEMLKWLCTKEFPTPDDESEYSNSSRSSFSMELDLKPAASYSMFSDDSGNWELAYIGDIVVSVGSILAEILLMPRKDSERPTQFEELEDWMNGMGKYEDKPNDRRKLLFDCTTECVESRCRHVFTGTDISWNGCNRMFERKPWFAEDVFGEITCRKGTGDVLVDELVDADMSSRQGKWIGFNAEIMEEGVKIGMGILVTLIDELVTDFCHGLCP